MSQPLGQIPGVWLPSSPDFSVSVPSWVLTTEAQLTPSPWHFPSSWALGPFPCFVFCSSPRPLWQQRHPYLSPSPGQAPTPHCFRAALLQKGLFCPERSCSSAGVQPGSHSLMPAPGWVGKLLSGHRCETWFRGSRLLCTPLAPALVPAHVWTFAISENRICLTSSLTESCVTWWIFDSEIIFWFAKLLVSKSIWNLALETLATGYFWWPNRWQYPWNRVGLDGVPFGGNSTERCVCGRAFSFSGKLSIVSDWKHIMEHLCAGVC